MKNSFFIKIYIPILLFTITILLIYGFINFEDQKKSYLKIMEAQTQAIAHTNILLNTKYILSNDKAELVSKSIDLLKDNKSIKYIIYDKNDNFKIFISKEKFSILDKLEKKYTDFYNDEVKYKILKANLYDKRVFHMLYKIKISQFDWGYIHIGISLKEYYQQLENIYIKFIFVTFLSLCFLIIVVYFFVRWITIPITDLTLFVNKIIKGELKEIEVKGNDEIAQLKKDFNIMIQYLRNSKKQEKYIYEQSKMTQMSQMLNNIAHQWRQPLSVITIGLSGIKLKKDLDILTDKDFEENYNIIMNNAYYLTETIDIFSKFTQDEKFIEVVNINSLIKDIVILNKDLLERNFIDLQLDLLNKDLSIETIPNVLSQVIINIIMNNNKIFKKDNKSEKLVKISLENIDKYICIKIENNLGNIEEDIINNDFDAYFTNTKFKELGLGLYLSFDLINTKLKGNISVKNTKLGAIFTIKIPKSIS